MGGGGGAPKTKSQTDCGSRFERAGRGRLRARLESGTESDSEVAGAACEWRGGGAAQAAGGGRP